MYYCSTIVVWSQQPYGDLKENPWRPSGIWVMLHANKVISLVARDLEADQANDPAVLSVCQTSYSQGIGHNPSTWLPLASCWVRPVWGEQRLATNMWPWTNFHTIWKLSKYPLQPPLQSFEISSLPSHDIVFWKWWGAIMVLSMHPKSLPLRRIVWISPCDQQLSIPAEQRSSWTHGADSETDVTEVWQHVYGSLHLLGYTLALVQSKSCRAAHVKTYPNNTTSTDKQLIPKWPHLAEFLKLNQTFKERQ